MLSCVPFVPFNNTLYADRHAYLSCYWIIAIRWANILWSAEGEDKTSLIYIWCVAIKGCTNTYCIAFDKFQPSIYQRSQPNEPIWLCEGWGGSAVTQGSKVWDIIPFVDHVFGQTSNFMNVCPSRSNVQVCGVEKNIKIIDTELQLISCCKNTDLGLCSKEFQYPEGKFRR